MKDLRTKASEKIEDLKEREMFLKGWDECFENYKEVSKISKQSIELTTELIKFVNDHILVSQGNKENGKVHNQHR